MTTKGSAYVRAANMRGAGAAFANGMRHAGILDVLQTAPGFRGRWRGATSTKYRAIDLWDLREDCPAFVEGNVTPQPASRDRASGSPKQVRSRHGQRTGRDGDPGAVVIENLDFVAARVEGCEQVANRPSRAKRGRNFRRHISGLPTAKLRGRLT